MRLVKHFTNVSVSAKMRLTFAAVVFSLGFLLYTVSVKVAVPVMPGEFRHGQSKP